MTKKEYKYFIETFEMSRTSFRKFNYRLKKDPFDYHAKLLLGAYRDYFKKNKDSITEKLKPKSFQDPFYEAVRLYLVGMMQNHFGTFRFAVENLKSSIEKFQSIEEDHFIINPLVLILISYSNQKDKENIKRYSTLLKNYEPRNDYYKIMINHALSVAYLELGLDKEALLSIDESLRLNSKDLLSYLPGFLLIKFGVYLKNEDFNECREILNKYKEAKGFTVKPNYIYMNSLLNHLVENSPLYAYYYDFETTPELYDQIEVIKNLAKNDITEAKRIWNKLSYNNPKLYKNDFIYNGNTCLFSLCLNKHRVIINNKQIVFESSLEKLKSPMQKLERIVSSKAFHSMTKEEMVKIIWEEETNEKNLARLRKLISRLNKDKGTKLIVSYQDTYKKVA